MIYSLAVSRVFITSRIDLPAIKPCYLLLRVWESAQAAATVFIMTEADSLRSTLTKDSGRRSFMIGDGSFGIGTNHRHRHVSGMN